MVKTMPRLVNILLVSYILLFYGCVTPHIEEAISNPVTEEIEDYVEKDTEETATKEKAEGGVVEVITKHTDYAFLLAYALLFALACFYYKKTGKHWKELEDALCLMLSRFTIKQRLILYGLKKLGKSTKKSNKKDK